EAARADCDKRLIDRPGGPELVDFRVNEGDDARPLIWLQAEVVRNRNGAEASEYDRDQITLRNSAHDQHRHDDWHPDHRHAEIGLLEDEHHGPADYCCDKAKLQHWMQPPELTEEKCDDEDAGDDSKLGGLEQAYAGHDEPAFGTPDFLPDHVRQDHHRDACEVRWERDPLGKAIRNQARHEEYRQADCDPRGLVVPVLVRAKKRRAIDRNDAKDAQDDDGCHQNPILPEKLAN